MALGRCKECGKPKGRTSAYVLSREPIAYPNTAAVCGSKGCENPAIIWLNVQEADAYDRGERVFPLPTAALKVRVD